MRNRIPVHCGRQALSGFYLCLFTLSYGVAGAGPVVARRDAALQEDRPSVGRVVVVITALDGTVHIAGVDVELKAVTENVVLAKTTTDGAGQVAFPDVPVGRYIVLATRPGFLPTESAPFDVRARRSRRCSWTCS